MRSSLQRQRGAVVIMVALSMFVILALLGLVIDGGLAYLVKARLNAAVDAAALAGARAVTDGNDQTQQTHSAQTAAADFFAANMPTTYLLSKPTLVRTDVAFKTGQATIDVYAEAPMPVSVMQLLGFKSLVPVAHAQTIRKDLDMAFVVDTSGSLSDVDGAVKTSAASFLNKFNVTQDRVALIHFAYGAEVDSAIRPVSRGFPRTEMLDRIKAYRFEGSTASVEGMWHARNQLNRISQQNRSSLRVIVFFSDGEPNAFGSYLDFNYPYSCKKAGVVTTDAGGLYDLGDSGGTLLSGCRVVNNGYLSVSPKLPAWYNAHNPASNPNDPSSREFKIVTGANRLGFERAVPDTLTSANFSTSMMNIARNLPEAVAAKARDEGIYVFTLGMGSALKRSSAGETGESILKCMANVPDAPKRCYDSNQPVGMYCYAATEADLTPCFSRLASAILRISQ